MKKLVGIFLNLGIIICFLSIGCSSRSKQEEKLTDKIIQPEITSEQEKSVTLSQKDMYIAQAQKYVEQGQNENAVKELQNALKIDPNDANVYYTLGNLYEQMGKNKESVEAFIKAIQLEPDKGKKESLEKEFLEKGSKRETVE